MDIVTQLAIIAEEESAAIYHFTLMTLSALVICISLFLVALVSSKLVKSVAFGMLIIASLVLAIGAVPKPKIDMWPVGVSDDGSHFDTNEWRFVELRWKLREGYPESTPLEFYCKPRAGGGDWAAMGVEPAGSRARRFDFWTAELPDNPTNYIYQVRSSYVPPALPSIELVEATVSNVTIHVSCATNYFGYSAMWEARRQMWLDTRLPIWGPWTELGDAIIFKATETNSVVDGSFVNGRRNTEIRLKMNISDEGSNGVRP